MPDDDLHPWWPQVARAREQQVLAESAGLDPVGLDERLHALVAAARRTHERTCLNLNPATNVMNPRAEALLSCGLGTRPSLGYPGAKYETGLEDVEAIEVMAAALVRQVFQATFAELRVASGSMANLYAFLATCRPGDRVIVPPPSIGGHVTHHQDGAAGLLGLEVHHAPVDAGGYTVDVEGLRQQAERLRPALITIGGSCNLAPPPVRAVAEVAHGVGAFLMVDAAHICGLLAGQVWPAPLGEGADLVTMSTYKSLGGPPAGLVLTDDEQLAARIDRIAHPGLTANFDVARTAALAITMLDWQAHGAAYAQQMVATAVALAAALERAAVPLWTLADGAATRSHQLVLDARTLGGGHAAAQRLRQANLLASAIGLPVDEGRLPPGESPGVRLGTPELVRLGGTASDATVLAELIARALREDPSRVAGDVTRFRASFDTVHYVRG